VACRNRLFASPGRLYAQASPDAIIIIAPNSAVYRSRAAFVGLAARQHLRHRKTGQCQIPGQELDIMQRRSNHCHKPSDLIGGKLSRSAGSMICSTALSPIRVSPD
jgi:hypothetical protein